MEPLEEVDGVSESVVAQGQIIPSYAIAAGKPYCQSLLKMRACPQNYLSAVLTAAGL